MSRVETIQIEIYCDCEPGMYCPKELTVVVNKADYPNPKTPVDAQTVAEAMIQKMILDKNWTEKENAHFCPECAAKEGETK